MFLFLVVPFWYIFVTKYFGEMKLNKNTHGMAGQA